MNDLEKALREAFNSDLDTPTSELVGDIGGRAERRRVRRTTTTAAAAVLAVVAVIAVAVAATVGGDQDSPDPAPTPTPILPTKNALPDSLADLPIGPRPDLAYVASGTSVVMGDVSVDLEGTVTTVGSGQSQVLVYDASQGTIRRVRRDRIDLLADAATSPPVFGANIAWIENDNQIVQLQSSGRSRQPLPDGCCAGARVVGYDHDINIDLFVTAQEGSWMWDTYEGREGQEDPPPDSEDYFWPVGGLGEGIVIDTGSGSEVLVRYPGEKWGWGYVSGPRDPASDTPVQYQEQELTSAIRVWLTTPAIVALETGGQLVVLEEEWHYNDPATGGSVAWRTLTGERKRFALPHGLMVAGVVTEDRRTVLVDAAEESGQRAWVRCNVQSLECEIATNLDADDITPE